MVGPTPWASGVRHHTPGPAASAGAHWGIDSATVSPTFWSKAEAFLATISGRLAAKRSVFQRHLDRRKNPSHPKQTTPIADIPMNMRSVRSVDHGKVTRQTIAATPQRITIQRATRCVSFRPFASAIFGPLVSTATLARALGPHQTERQPGQHSSIRSKQH